MIYSCDLRTVEINKEQEIIMKLTDQTMHDEE